MKKIFLNFIDATILTISSIVLGCLLNAFTEPYFKHTAYSAILAFFVIAFVIYTYIKLIIRR